MEVLIGFYTIFSRVVTIIILVTNIIGLIVYLITENKNVLTQN